MAIDLDVIEKSGAWFKIKDPMNETGYMTWDNGEIVKFQGQVNLMNFLRETPAAFEYVNNTVMSRVTGDMLQIDGETDLKAMEEANALAENPLVRMSEDTEQPIENQIVDEIPFEETTV